MERSDAELVLAASRGDLECFGQLFQRHYRMAVGIAHCRLSDGHLAEDAAQEAFVIACRTLSTLRQPDRFPHWLGTITRRTASRLAVSQPKDVPLSENQEPTSDVAAAVLHQQVHEALEQLDETSREIVLLHYFSGLSYEAIAEVIDLSKPAIHGRLQRARNRLAEVLAPNPT